MIFVLNSETQSINIASNESTLVVFSNIAPTITGEIEVTVDNHEMEHAYVNVMEFRQTPDPLGIVLSTTALDVPEGSTNSLTLRLSNQPENTTTVTVSQASGDTDLSVLSGSPAVFTTNNWDVWQPIVMEAAEDADTDNGSATFQCSGDSLTATQITATESENDLALQISSATLTVPEGGTSDLRVRLNTDPVHAYTVTVSRVSGDEDISIASGASLIFTSADYMNWQTSVVAAAQDADETEGSAVIRLSSAAADSVDVTATEQDDDLTVVATGLLAAWDLDSITSSPVVTETNAYFMATGLVQSVLTHSDPSEMRGANTALKAIDNDEATIADAITAGNYFYWQLQPQSSYLAHRHVRGAHRHGYGTRRPKHLC